MDYPKQFTPHIRRKASTFSQRREFFLCVCVLWISSRIYYFVTAGKGYGLAVILLGITGIVFAMIPDIFWNLSVFFSKEHKHDAFKEFLYRVIHSYSFVTGLLLALLCPIGLPFWKLAIGAVLSILVFKLFFGGFGKNILNPAIFGRVFLQLAFTSDRKTYLGQKPEDFTISTGASVTGLINSKNGFSPIVSGLSFKNRIIGNYRGTLGETFILVLLAICIYLCVRKIIDWRVPVTYIGTLFIAFVLMFLSAGDGGWAFKDAFRYLAIGGIFFGGILCLTDPVTSPTSRSGRMRFALTSALITLLIRLYTGSPEGVAYSILIANVMTPFFDKINTGRTNKKLVPIAVNASLFALVLLSALVYGFRNKVNPSTGRFLKGR